MRWTSQVTDTLVVDTEATFLPAGPLTASFTPGEGQKVVAHLTSKDVYDQERTQTFVAYADGPLTPDYVWLDELTAAAPFGSSDCTLLGVDRRVARHAVGNAALSAEQALRSLLERGGAAPELDRRQLGQRRRPLHLPRHDLGERLDPGVRSLPCDGRAKRHHAADGADRPWRQIAWCGCAMPVTLCC